MCPGDSQPPCTAPAQPSDKQLEAAHRDLVALRDEAKSAAAAARKTRRRAEGDCAQAVQEFDTEVGERDRELVAAEAAHGEVTRQIEVSSAW